VSALGHYLEEEGIATVAVVLIRPQAENTKPPRALWVPFELGRPFGPPNDAAFQKRVILAALGMLVEDGGPVRRGALSVSAARPDPEFRGSGLDKRRMRLSRLGTDSSLPPDYQGFRGRVRVGPIDPRGGSAEQLPAHHRSGF